MPDALPHNWPYCKCKEENYAYADQECRKNCTGLRDPCINGGRCLKDACQCLSGTRGDWCNIVEGCWWSERGEPKCGKSNLATCEFNQTSKQPYCKCIRAGYSFDRFNRKCKACDCGDHGICTMYNGVKRCDCDEGYKESPAEWVFPSTCQPCNCGDNSLECKFKNHYDKECSCKSGYSQKGEKCQECDCGPNGKCSFVNETKACDCKQGYAQVPDTLPGKGQCQTCDCGEYSTGCKFKSNGDKECICESGYSPKGDGCSDVDECVEFNKCSLRDTTNCINTNGSYYCECKHGYYAKTYSIELDGCQQDQKGMKAGYIVLIVVGCLAVVGGVVFIYKRKRSS